MNVALDAMGGDHAPRETVLGAISAAPKIEGTLFLVGDEAILRKLLPAGSPSNIVIVHADTCVDMDEKPTEAYRKKKDSSLMVAAEMVKDGRAHAMVSAGNTGAAVTFSLLCWRRLPGIDRPAIAARMPNRHDGFLLLDAGASPDADPAHLVQFARMGRAYAARVMGRLDPKVHLLNIGEEPGKGNAHAKASYDLLAPEPWFAGNIEGKDLWRNPIDVVVCDAFVGNVVLKTSEGLAEMIAGTIREGVPANPVGRAMYWPVAKVMAPIKKDLDYAETGGSPLLGLNGTCIIAHGRSNARAIMNAVLLADRTAAADLASHLVTV